jgi:hypothetical protein
MAADMITMTAVVKSVRSTNDSSTVAMMQLAAALG